MSLQLDKRKLRSSIDFTPEWRDNLRVAQINLNKKKNIPSYRHCLVCSLPIPTRSKGGFLIRKSQYELSKFCSVICKAKYSSNRMRGESNPNWKGGVSTENQIIRGSFEYKKWRDIVFKRDKYTCQICFKTGGDIEADHIKQFAFYPELRLNIDNGRTLCKRCHKGTETYQNTKNNKII